MKFIHIDNFSCIKHSINLVKCFSKCHSYLVRNIVKIREIQHSEKHFLTLKCNHIFYLVQSFMWQLNDYIITYQWNLYSWFFFQNGGNDLKIYVHIKSKRTDQIFIQLCFITPTHINWNTVFQIINPNF